jgi:hypothetical protein
MRWSLRHDEATGELRLVAIDYWAGKHEHREWRTLRDDGSIVKHRKDLDGRPVYSDGPGNGFYITYNDGTSYAPRGYIKSQDTPVVDESTPCRRAENRRRKCPLCAEAIIA